MKTATRLIGFLAMILLLSSQIYSLNGIKQVTQQDIDFTQEINDDDITQYNNFQQKQAEIEAIGEEKTAKMDPTFESYKDDIYNKIINRGRVQTQIDAVKSVGVLAINNEFGKPMESFLQTEMAYPASDDPDNFFVNEQYTASIGSIPTSGRSKVTPWSGTYWAMKNGGISVRYAMNSFNTIGAVSGTGYSSYYTWRQSVGMYSQPYTHQNISRYGQSYYTNYISQAYSPAEKYDLAVGDVSFTLTRYLKAEGNRYQTGGTIPGWFGICHGWAPAAYLYSRPTKPVTITAADGKNKITFLPDDIKALASQFLANADYTTRWIGARCSAYVGNSGWYTDPACRSLNPGALLITIGNWVGINKKSLVMDPQADPEVWNQPFNSYSVRYYNPSNTSFYSSFNSNRITRSQLNYCYSSLCNAVKSKVGANTAYIVGAFFSINYTVETTAIHESYTLGNQFKTENYDGAIELDSNNNIIGGAWKGTSYPNFMWMPDENLPITSVSDGSLPTYTGSYTQLQGLAQAAKSASSQGQIIKNFVNYLVKMSK